MAAPREKRQWERVPAVYALGFERYVGGNKVSEDTAHCLNLSGRGIAFETRQRIELNDTVVIWLMNVYYTLRARGAVKHAERTEHDTYVVGVQLQSMLEGDWRTLERDVALLRKLQDQTESKPTDKSLDE